MANMGYCRFQNTLNDLEDVNAHLEDPLSEDEHRSRKALITLCREIADQFEDEDLDGLPKMADEDTRDSE